MNILADESVDYRIINFLRKNSFHITAIISDTEVLKKANEQNALLITEDKDFGELVFRLKLKHKGVLLLRFLNIAMIFKIEKFWKYYKCIIRNYPIIFQH